MTELALTKESAVADFLREVADCDRLSLCSLRSVCIEAKSERNPETKQLMTNFIKIIDTVGTLRYGDKWLIRSRNKLDQLH